MHYRIPPELFDIIIDSFTEWPTFNPGLGVRMTKRELGACSLVCRYWARRCRYWIFATLSVRSREDFNDLLHLIDTAHEMDDIPPLTECIQDLQVQHAGPWTMPWFHRILKELTARGLELEPENISLEVKEAYVPEVHHSEDQTSSHYAPRSLSTSLPRTIPRSMFSHAMLALSDLRFRRVKDLLRLIDDQADLQQIAWTRLSFDAGTVVPPSRMRTRRSWESNETVSTSEWADVELEVQIMFLIASEKAEEAFAVVPEAWQAMVKASVALKLPSTYRLVLRQRGDALGMAYEPASPDSMGTHLVEFHIAAPTTRVIHPHITTVRLWLRPNLPITELAAVDWNALEDALSSLSPAPDIDIVAENREGSDGAQHIFGWFLDNIFPNTPSQSSPDTTAPRVIFSQAHAAGRLNVRMALTDRMREWRHCEYLTMREVLREPIEYEVRGRMVKLSLGEVVKVMLCRDGKEKERVLEGLVEGKAGAQDKTK